MVALLSLSTVSWTGCKPVTGASLLSLEDTIASLPDAATQRRRLCGESANDDAVKDLFCSDKLQAAGDLPTLLRALRLDSDAKARLDVLPTSLSLDGAKVSPRRPSVIYSSGAEMSDFAFGPGAPGAPGAVETSSGDQVMLHFTRGTAAVEMIARDRAHGGQLNFYLMTYDIDCASAKCTPQELGAEKVEKDWRNVNLYADTHLAKTGLDCRTCHAVDREGHKKVLMSDPVNCTFDDRDPRSGAMCTKLRGATSDPEAPMMALGFGSQNKDRATATATATTTSTAVGTGTKPGNGGGGDYGKGKQRQALAPETRTALVDAYNQRTRSDAFYGGANPEAVGRRLGEALDPLRSRFPGFPPGGPGAALRTMQGPGLDGDLRVQLALSQVGSDRAVDPGKVANLDLEEHEIFRDDATPAPRLLQDACMLCHHREETPDSPASRFNVLTLDPMFGDAKPLTAAAAAEALRRLDLPANDPGVMPPVDFRRLSEAEKAALRAYLKGGETAP